MGKRLCCPNCGGLDLYGTFPTEIWYSQRYYLDGEEIKVHDAEADRIVLDEGLSDNGVICRSCMQPISQIDLVPLDRYAHRNYPVSDVMGVDEDSTRGGDIRYQAVCYASHETYSCSWCSRWHHADTFDTDHYRNARKPADPAQLAYEAAEADGRQHLVEWGALTDQEGAGTTPGDRNGAASDVADHRPAESAAPRG